MEIAISVNSGSALKALSDAISRAGNMKPLMQAFGRHMQVSVRQNFDQGGRPKWDPLRYAYVQPKGTRRRKGRRVQGSARMGGPLVLTGDLRAHIGFTGYDSSLSIWAAPANDAVKAPVQQFGTTRAGRGHNVTIPARPYLVFQKEDITFFQQLARSWIRVGLDALENGS